MLSTGLLQGAALCHQISQSCLQKEGTEKLKKVGKGEQMERKMCGKMDEWETGKGNKEEGGVEGEELREERKEGGGKGEKKETGGRGRRRLSKTQDYNRKTEPQLSVPSHFLVVLGFQRFQETDSH